MNRLFASPPLLLAALAMLACGADPTPSLFVVVVTVTLEGPAADAVESVTVTVWDSADLAVSAAPTPLSTAELGNIVDDAPSLRLPVPGGTTLMDIECTASTRTGQILARGFARSVRVLDPTPVRCVVAIDQQAGLGVVGQHDLESVVVQPEPADCDGDTIRYDLVVSEPRGDTYTLYATGVADRIAPLPLDERALRGRVVWLPEQAAAPDGSTYSVAFVHKDRSSLDERPDNLFIIDPDTNQGYVVRNRTRCRTGWGQHDLEVRVVAYFFTDGEHFAFEVTRDGLGNLSWACDVDLDGEPDYPQSAPAASLLAVELTEQGHFRLLVSGPGSTVTRHDVSCVP